MKFAERMRDNGVRARRAYGMRQFAATANIYRGRLGDDAVQPRGCRPPRFENPALSTMVGDAPGVARTAGHEGV